MGSRETVRAGFWGPSLQLHKDQGSGKIAQNAPGTWVGGGGGKKWQGGYQLQVMMVVLPKGPFPRIECKSRETKQDYIGLLKQ